MELDMFCVFGFERNGAKVCSKRGVPQDDERPGA
jgi:hypothetical protein